LPALKDPFNILVTGIGGTGVVTIGALLGMAAHLESKGCSIMDMTGLAPKRRRGPSRTCASPTGRKRFTRCASPPVTPTCCSAAISSLPPPSMRWPRAGSATAAPSSTATRPSPPISPATPDYRFPGQTLKAAIEAAVSPGAAEFVDATGLATTLIGDSIATNLFMLGFAYQRGLIPVSAAAIERAIDLNRTSANENKLAFLWGRRAAVDLAGVEKAAARMSAAPRRIPETLDEIVAHRSQHLTSYQHAAYAARYRNLVERVIAAERAAMPGSQALSIAAAKYYAKLLAYKDEYEVARLHSDPVFRERIAAQFEGDYKLHFHLAPPGVSRADPVTGRIKKKQFGPWMMARVRRPGADERPAWHRVRSLCQVGGPQAGAAPDRGIRGVDRGDRRRPLAREPRNGGRAGPGCRSRFAAMATSRTPMSRLPGSAGRSF
jgi:indolepyruvate ferredoxin oxidoreductase